MEGRISCNICFSDELEQNQVKELPCKHIVCLKCFPRIIKKVCPYCRAPFGSDKEIKEGENILTTNYIENMYIRDNIYRPPIYYIQQERVSRSLPNDSDFDFYANTRVGRRMRRREKLMDKNGRKKDIRIDSKVVDSKKKRWNQPREYEDIFEMEDI